MPVAGYRKVGAGKIYFIGGNLTFYAYDQRRPDLIKFIDKFIANPRASGLPPSVRVAAERLKPDSISFKYRANGAWPALISRTFSPHWRAVLDNRLELPVNKMEGLMELNLPKGKHEVAMVYGQTLVHPLSVIVSFIAWFSVIIAFRRRRQRGMNRVVG